MTNDIKKWRKKDIAIKDLLLWDENARFPEEYFKKTENELIEYFLNRKDLKVDDLAKEIANEFDLPQLEKIVVLEMNGKNIVLEGNRRLAAYKLLINPTLTKRVDLKKSFEEQKKRISIDENFILEANVTTDKDEGLRFVDRKHNKGNNEIGWGEPERRNFAIRRSHGKVKDVLRVELANAVKKLSLPDAIKEAVLGKGYVTTFYRIVDSAAARKKLGYEILEDGQININDQKVFDDLLKIIAFNVWNKKDFSGGDVDSRSLNKIDAIETYVKKIQQKSVANIDKEIKKRTKEDLFGGQTLISESRGRSKQLSVLRKHLIISSLYIPARRVNDIYDELKRKLDVDNTPNAVAVLFRVFLECSVDCYIEKYKILVKDDIQLAGKILKVVDHLEDLLARKYLQENKILKPTADDLKKAKQKVKLKEIRKVATKDNNSILSVTTFHDFVHDHKSSPIPSELKKYWENLDSFFVALWKICSQNQKKK
jgi:hypothetical protein